jgi:hypothetical protein
MSSFILAHLPSGKMLPGDWELLARAMKHDYSGWDVVSLSRDLDSKDAQLWIVEGAETRLLLVTEVLILPHARELHLRYIAGEGWFGHLHHIIPLIDQLAAGFGCRYVTGRFRGKHALKVYEQFGGKAAGVHIVKDLANGQQKDNHHSADGPGSRSRGGNQVGSPTVH